MYAMLLAGNADERAILSLVLQRAGLAVTTAHSLDRAMKSWLERPADLIATALKGDPLEHVRRLRADGVQIPVAYLVCNFTDGSSDPDGTVVARSWDFDDGTNSSLTNPQHAFASLRYSYELSR